MRNKYTENLQLFTSMISENAQLSIQNNETFVVFDLLDEQLKQKTETITNKLIGRMTDEVTTWESQRSERVFDEFHQRIKDPLPMYYGN